MDEVLNLEEVSKYLKASKRTVQREVESGKLKAFRVGKSLRFKKDEVEEYIEKQRIHPGEELEDTDETEDAAY